MPITAHNARVDIAIRPMRNIYMLPSFSIRNHLITGDILWKYKTSHGRAESVTSLQEWYREMGIYCYTSKSSEKASTSFARDFAVQLATRKVTGHMGPWLTT